MSSPARASTDNPNPGSQPRRSLLSASSTPKGLRPVATGKPALRGRNPWIDAPQSTRPGRGGGILIFVDLSTKKLLRPCWAGAQLRHAPTGSASAGFAAPPLHPWLHPSAPLGPRTPVPCHLRHILDQRARPHAKHGPDRLGLLLRGPQSSERRLHFLGYFWSRLNTRVVVCEHPQVLPKPLSPLVTNHLGGLPSRLCRGGVVYCQ